MASETATANVRPFFGRVESLRGIGALAVAGYHISGWPLHGVALLPSIPWESTGIEQNALRRLGLALLPAHAALMIFFVISGFVLRVSLEYGPQKLPTAAAKFFLSRIFRIYPVVIFSLFLTAVLGGWQASPHGQPARPLSAPLFFANLLLLDVSMNGAFWALQVELLMAPVILVLYLLERSHGPRVLLGIALVTTALAYHTLWAFWPPLSTNVFPFVLGMVVPTIGCRFARDLSKRAATCWALGAVIALVLPGTCLGLYSRQSAVIEAYAAVILVCLIAYRFDIGWLKCLDAKALRLLGRSSGSYYVLHMATVPMALALASALIPPAWSANAPALVGLLVIAAWLVVIVPLTVCSFYLIEAPGIALGHWVAHFCQLDTHPVTGPVRESVTHRHAA